MKLNNKKRAFLGAMSFLIFIIIFIAGLWPFNFWPENRVRWLKDRDGVEFYGQAMIFSNAPAPYSLSPFSLEIWLHTTSESASHIGRLFSFFNKNGPETIFIGQWRSHLLLGKGTHGKATYREIGVRGVFKKGEKRFVTITSGTEGTHIYVDGILQKFSPNFHLFPNYKNPSGNVLLGNSPAGTEYWTGILLSLSIYDRALTGQEVYRHFQEMSRSKEEGLVTFYAFDDRFGNLVRDRAGEYHLVMPPRLKAFQKTILVPPWEDFRWNRSYLKDTLLNLLGFVPLGFFLSAYLWTKRNATTRRILLISILFASCLSFIIEIVQVYLPTRSSQFMDVVMNIIGTALGATLFLKNRKS